MSAIKKIMSVAAVLSVFFFGFGGVVSAADVPSSVALGATSITNTTASLTGTVNPKGSSTEYWMEYGTNNQFQYSTTRYSAGSGTSAVSVSQPVTGLTAGTSYQYKIIASNSVGSIAGNVKTFTTTAGSSSSGGSSSSLDAPSTVATGAVNISSDRATLNGTVNPKGSSTEYWIEYGTNNGFQYATQRYSAGSGTSAVSVSQPVTGLTAGTAYQYKIVAVNSVASIAGNVRVFTTTSGSSVTPTVTGDVPSATAKEASSIYTNEAVLNGSVNPNGASTEYWFEYGTNDQYQYATQHYSAGSGTYATSVNQKVTGLTAGTAYQYKIVAKSSIGSIASNVKYFSTITSGGGSTVTGDVPSATAIGYSSVTSNSAYVSGTVNPNGLSTEYWFEYGTGDSFGSRTGSYFMGSGTGSYSTGATLNGLVANTSYGFKLVAKNSAGSIASNVKYFTTSSNGSVPVIGSAPVVNLSSAYGITKDSATFSGSIDPKGSWTEYWFEYGTQSGNLNLVTSKWSINEYSGNTSVTSPVYNLQSGITYYYRLVAKNGYGQQYSPALSFMTQGSGGGNYGSPYVTTIGATGINSSTATLNADISPNGYSTEVWFEYGYAGNNFGRVSGSRSFGGDNGTRRASIEIYGLSPNISYEFRSVARSAYGTVYGSTLSFTTQGGGYGYYGAPQATTAGASTVLQNVALLKGTINPNGSTTNVWFEYGTSTYDLKFKTAEQSVPGYSAIKDFYFGLTGLSSGTTYYYRAVASNAYGVSRGEVYHLKTLSFWTPPTGGGGTTVIEKKVIIKEQISSDEESGIMLDPSVNNLNPSAGETIDYVLTYRNASKGEITGSTLKVTLPFETEYVDSSVRPTSQLGNNLSFYVGDIEKGNQGAVTIKVKINDDIKDGSSLMFNSFLEFTDSADKFQTVNSYIAVLVKGGSNVGFLASLSEFAKSLSGSWLMLILLILMLVTIIYLLVTRKRTEAKN